MQKITSGLFAAVLSGDSAETTVTLSFNGESFFHASDMAVYVLHDVQKKISLLTQQLRATLEATTKIYSRYRSLASILDTNAPAIDLAMFEVSILRAETVEAEMAMLQRNIKQIEHTLSMLDGLWTKLSKVFRGW